MYLEFRFTTKDAKERKGFFASFVSFAVKTSFILTPFIPTTFAAEKEMCVYAAQDGRVVQVNSIDKVPAELRPYAKCFPISQSNYLAKPEEIELKGNKREEHMVTAVGTINLRWQRKSELLFGRTPQRAMADAAQVVSRALKQAGFTSELQSLNIPWEVVFMDEEVPESQIPAYLVSNCHPAWMTPPSNIYVVAQRVVAGCDGRAAMSSTKSDAYLAQVLIHEMGHVVEHKLLNYNASNDRMRAEGFASWFEQFACDYSSVIPRGSVEQYYSGFARQAYARGGLHQPFSGSVHDYALSSMYFKAIVSRRGVRGLMEVYSSIRDDSLEFLPAIKKRLGWDEKQLENEIKRVM